jgi:S1-C subfamily serine protease
MVCRRTGYYQPGSRGGTRGRSGFRGSSSTQEIAGLTVPLGDVITEVEGERVTTSDDVSKVVSSAQPGEVLDLTVVTPGGAPREVEVTLGDQPEDQESSPPGILPGG